MVGCCAVWRTSWRVLLISARSVSVSGLTPPGCFPDLEGIDGNLDGHRGVRRVGGVDRGVTMPARDLDGKVVAGLGAQPGTGGVDQEPAGLRSDPVGSSHPQVLRLRRRQNACWCRGIEGCAGW